MVARLLPQAPPEPADEHPGHHAAGILVSGCFVCDYELRELNASAETVEADEANEEARLIEAWESRRGGRLR